MGERQSHDAVLAHDMKELRMTSDAYRCTSEHPMPPTLSAVERRQWVHTDVLGFYDGVYYWEYECQHCGTKFEAMPVEVRKATSKDKP